MSDLSAVLSTKPPLWSELVLEYDPFDGDFGDGSERTLTDEIRVAKRRGECRECGETITAGQLTRVIKKVDSDGFYGGRCCELCCNAMAHVSEAMRGEGDDDSAMTDEEYDKKRDAMDVRHRIRLDKEAAARGAPNAD